MNFPAAYGVWKIRSVFMEKNLHDFLVGWTVDFVKNNDAISKKIEKIERGKGGFDLHVKYKDKEQYFIILPKIEGIGAIMEKINIDAYFSIVTLNSKENLDAVLKDWKCLCGFKFLSIIFINPFSEDDKKWAISPYIHDRVCDESSLGLGLKAMFETVDAIEERQLAARLTG